MAGVRGRQLHPQLCLRCGETDPEKFYVRGGYRDRTVCRACRNKESREERKAVYDPAKKRADDLLRKYGVTLEQYDTLLAKQGDICAGCARPHELAQGEHAWPVDHDHATGRVRGVLCHPCNRALGLVRDEPETLMRLAGYVAVS